MFRTETWFRRWDSAVNEIPRNDPYTARSSVTWRRGSCGGASRRRVDFILPRFPKKPWEILKFHYFPLIFIKNQSILIENQWKIIEFQDFQLFLGKSGKYEIHPPKLCARLPLSSFQSAQCRGVCSACTTLATWDCFSITDAAGMFVVFKLPHWTIPAHNLGGWILYFPDFPRNIGKSRKSMILH